MKRQRAGSSDSEDTCEAGDDLLAGAAVLLGLRNAYWGTQHQSARQEVEQSQTETLKASISLAKPSDVSVMKVSKPPMKMQKSMLSTRSYVWRGPHRGAVALRKAVDRNGQATIEASPASSSAPAASEAPVVAKSPKWEPVSGSDEEDGSADAASGSKQRDKEWAALTTWLRMNLHHPRTLKKVVLFVGNQQHPSGRWMFDLNPALAWDDVSIETKLRLKMLPQETETAFVHKYPERPSSEWVLKSQKYKPQGSSCTATVPLGDMVYSLSAIYFRNEGAQEERRLQLAAQQQQQQPCSGLQPGAGEASACKVDEPAQVTTDASEHAALLPVMQQAREAVVREAAPQQAGTAHQADLAQQQQQLIEALQQQADRLQQQLQEAAAAQREARCAVQRPQWLLPGAATCAGTAADAGAHTTPGTTATLQAAQCAVRGSNSRHSEDGGSDSCTEAMSPRCKPALVAAC